MLMFQLRRNGREIGLRLPIWSLRYSVSARLFPLRRYVDPRDSFDRPDTCRNGELVLDLRNPKCHCWRPLSSRRLRSRDLSRECLISRYSAYNPSRGSVMGLDVLHGAISG
jgi:hypothetical protein